MIRSKFILSLVLISIALSGCSQTEPAEEPSVDDVSVAPLAAEARGTSYPSDPNARFEIISSKNLPNGNLEVLNRRDGPSGTSFSRREISCSDYTYRYLGEGDTLEQAEQDSPNQGSMSELTGTSASSDIADAACKGR